MSVYKKPGNYKEQNKDFDREKSKAMKILKLVLVEVMLRTICQVSFPKKVTAVIT